MVPVGATPKLSPSRTGTSRSKQFTIIITTLGVMMLVWLQAASPKGENRAISTLPQFPRPWGKALTSNTDLNDTNGSRIRQISLIGERNSGTRWTWAHLSECFNNSIPVERHLVRYKHWFQFPNESAYEHDTLVIAQFRNPYDWLKAMQRVPHHAPSHLKKEWKEFLTIPWTAPRVGEDIEIGETITEANNDTDSTPCQQFFIYQDIVSCAIRPLPKEAYDHKLRFSEDTPFYEHRVDHSGLPYNNIMEMRAAKIENFLQVQSYPGIAAVWAVQYEYLLQRGTEHLINRVAEWTGIKPMCDPYPAQLRRERPFEPGFVDYITENLNWTAENLIGYGKYNKGTPKDITITTPQETSPNEEATEDNKA